MSAPCIVFVVVPAIEYKKGATVTVLIDRDVLTTIFPAEQVIAELT